MNGVPDLGIWAPGRIKCRINMISDEKIESELHGYILLFLGVMTLRGTMVMTKEKRKCHRRTGTHSPVADDRPELLTPDSTSSPECNSIVLI